MRREKKLLSWAKGHPERYFYQSISQSFFFWTVTLLSLLLFAIWLWAFLKYRSLFPAYLQPLLAALVVFTLVPWARAYVLHKRVRQLMKEGDPKEEKLLTEVASFSFYMTMVAYVIIGLSHQLILYFLRK
jgi:uncharacterized membrane protein YidH (DUF202 family)